MIQALSQIQVISLGYTLYALLQTAVFKVVLIGTDIIITGFSGLVLLQTFLCTLLQLTLLSFLRARYTIGNKKTQ